MAYKSKAMQMWAGENQPASVENNQYKSVAMQRYMAEKAQRAQQEEAERQQALLAQQEAEAPRRATLKDLTLGSIGKGYATSRYGNERYDEIMLGTQRQAKQAQKAKEKLEQEKYNFEAKSKAGQAISGAGELIGQIAYNLTNKDTLGSVGANVAGASAVGAVVPLPEELVTIPVAVGRGLKIGSAATSFQVSAAQAYDEMLEAGVSPKTAKTVANVIGGGVAALDAMQVDELAKGFKLAKNAKTEAGEKAAANIAKALAKVGKSTAIETGQEVAQEAVTMVGQDVAKRQEGIKTFSGEEYKQRLGDTAVQSALSFGLLGGAGAVGGAVMNRNNVKTQANEANRAINEAENTPNRADNEAENTPNRAINSAESEAKVAENAALSAENGTKSSKTAINNTENADLRANIASERYGAEGKKVFDAVKAEPQKAAEFDAYYREGVMGKEMPQMKGVLNETEATAAYNAGKVDGEANRTAYAQKRYVVNKNAGLNAESAKNVAFGDKVVYNTIGKAFGKEVVVVPTLKNSDGESINAKIDLANGRIYIAEYAQNGGRVALAHEVVHDMRVAAPTEFDNLAKLVTDYHKRFNSYDSKFAETAKRYELDKGEIDYYDMMEEMVADFIADNKGAERIVDMLSTDKTLAQKFIDSVKKAVVKLGKLALDKETRKIVNEWEDLVKQLENVVKATEQKVKETKYPADAKIGDDSFVVSEVRESRKSATYDIAQDEMRQDLVKYGIFTEAESYQFVNSISKLIDEVITPNAAILDMNEDFDRDDRKNISYKPNSDSLYKVSLDFSTLCKKRLMSQYVTEQLQLRLGRAITNKEQLAIRDRLLELKKENDSIEVACALCYVEAARLKSPVQINRFLKDRTGYMTKYFAKANKEFDAKVKQLQIDMKVERGYDADATISKLPQKDKNAINDATRKMRMAYKPSAEEMAVIEIANSLDDRAFLTLGNLEKLAEEQPDIYKAFAGHVASSTRSKELQGNTAYYYGDSKREGVSDALIALMNAENGLRHQSWSDFQSIHLLDTIVAIAELSTRKAKMQAYTKVPNFVKLVGRTGMMINLSLIPDGRTGFINGKLAFSNIEGMDFETAKKLRDTYANTTGTIAIGINDQQIKALLASGEIDYVIPYHASGLNKELRRIVKLESWDDYQNKQSEKKIEGYANLANNPDWHKKPDFSEWFKADEIDTTKDGVTIMREAAERYKQLCRERGLKPKFDDFKNEANYWKLLIDRKMVDHKTGKIIMQEAVRPIFDFDVITEMLNEEVQSYDANLNERLMDTLVGFYGDGGKNSEISQRIKQLDKEGKAREAAKKKGVYEAYEQFPMIDVAVAGDERYSRKDAENKKITVGMTDSERTDILKTKSIVAEVYNGQADDVIEKEKHNLESNKLSLIQKALLQIGTQFGVDTDYDIKDVELKVNYSKRNLQESIDKALDATQMAKLMPIFKNAVESSIGIESHSNRYFYDIDTMRFDNLVGGYVDGNNFIPIRFGLKHRKNGKVVLYVVVDNEKIPLNKIKAELSVNTDVQNVRKESTGSAYNISIKDIAPFVNGKDLLRYIPDNMLDEKQTKLKWEAIAETVGKTNNKNDKHYTKYLENGKLTNAYSMVKSAAKYYGYTIEAWHGTRQTFTAFSKDKRGNNTRTELSKKWFFAGDKDTANSYYPYGVIKELQGVEAADKMRDDVKGNLYHLFIKMENPLIVDVAGYDYAAHREKADAFMEYVEQAERNGNDGIILHHVRDNQLNPSAEDSTIYLFKEPSQAKSADIITYDDNDNIIPISQRFNENEEDMRYSRKSEPIIPDGYKERGFNESVRTKTDYDDIVQQEFIDNPEIYKQLANKVTKEKAKAIMDKGLAFAETEFPKLLERMDATAIALGDMMAREYSNMGEYDKAVTTIRDMAKQLTKAGQFSQAAVIALTKSNPMTALAYAKRDIDKLNADGHKQFGKKWKDFEITAEEEQMFKNIKQGDADAIKAAYEKINKRIAKEYPSTIWQKFIEASRISMLLNPRTNVKNVVSNLFLYPVTRGSGILSSKLQKVYAYYNKDYKPNQSGLLKKDIRKQAEGVWDKVKDTFDTTSKYNEGIKANKRDIVVFKEGMGTRVMENIAPGTLHKLNSLMNTDDAGLMETLRHATYWLLEYGDNIFVKQNFISRLGSYMQAKGITDINTMSEEDMAAAIEVAYREALRATFKDDTALSKWMASIKHTGNPYIDAMMEMIMPFTKTPANIAMRGIDYSPIGLINTITKAKKGADASEVIDELSKNLLGSALIAIGALLFSKGIVTGGEPENEKEAAFLKQQGWQPYAVKVGDGYATYDWAQPAAIPIIMGVTIMESLEEGRLGVVDAVKNAGVASFNQWVELSPLQSLKEVMGGYGTVGENLLNTAIEMPQRLIPSALGATARTADTTQRLTYSKGNVAQTQKDLAKSKVPGLSQTLPAAYDTWGREKKRDDSTGLAAFNQFINPSTYKGTNATEADREINRLYNELGDSAIYPRKASYSIEKGGKTYTLSNAEYSEYQRIMGQLSYDGVKALMAKPAYNELTDHEKAEIIKDIYDNAFEKAKYTIMEGQGYKKTEEDIRTAKETKIKQAYLQDTPENIAEYYIAYYILNNADSDKTASGTTIAGSKKKNGINRLVELGYSRTEARRLYDRLKG